MRDKQNLYAYTHKRKHKKHNKHNNNKNNNGSDSSVFDDRRNAPSLHDITLKMRKMYDAVAGSFSSFNDPSKPFTAIDYRRIHNGWKNKKNGRRGMNRMNRMKRMIGGVTTTPCINENQPTGKTVYEMVAANIRDADNGLRVSIRRNGKKNFEAFIGDLAANDAENAEAEKKAKTAENVRVDDLAEAGKVRLLAASGAEVKLPGTFPVAKKKIDEPEDTPFITAAALSSIATAMAIAAENEKSTEDGTAELLLKAAALASIATAMAIASP